MNGISTIAFICLHRKCLKIILHFFFYLIIPFSAFSVTGVNTHPDLYPTKIAFEISNIENLAGDSSEVNALLRLFDETIGSNVVLAEKYASDALVLSEKSDYSKGLIDSHRSLGDIYRIKGNFEQAEKVIQQAISLSELAEDEIALAKCYLAMYRLFFAKGDYNEAADFNKKSLNIGKKSSSLDILADAYGNVGISHGMKGEHITAIEYFLKSLEMYKSLKDELHAGITLMRIGHTFELAGSYEKALDYLFQSLEITQRLNNAGNTGWCLLNIGVTYSRIDEHNHALKRDYYEQALVFAEKANDFRLILACLDNIGGSYSMAGDFKNANVYLMKAYRLSQEAGHNSRTVYITGNLAENFLYTGQLDSAVLFGEENLRIAIQEDNTFEKRQAYSVLSQIYAARNENKKAYEMLSRHTNLSDSIFNVQKSQQIEDLREKYETEVKEKEIQLLTKEKAAAVFRRNSFAVLSALFLMMGFLVFTVLRLRVRKKQLLLEKEIELDRMKSRFFANISHEFRTPLTLILGPIDDMITRTENSGIQKYLKPMRRNAGRLLELVNQLLELSRIESGRLKPELTKSNIVSIVKGVGMSFDSLAEMKNIRLEVIPGREPIEIYIDKDKIEKILTNLLSNAFKFTPEKGTISVHVHLTSDSHIPGFAECLQIIVKDSGRGIPQAELVHIFDRFYQADNNQLHQQDGSGIGLALTKELVELHRGTIWAYSDVDAGTEIRIQLPLNLDEIMEECIAETGQSLALADPAIRINDDNGKDFADAGQEENDAHKPIVLLIEDHVDVRNYIRDTLDQTFTVIEAADGEDGVAVALDKIPDLILCDVMMPKMNGHQVCVLLKKDERTSHIPIILLTAKADMESRIEGLEIQADDYLTKPFVPKELMLRIKNLIESRQKLREKYLRGLTLKPNEVAVNSIDEQFLKRMMEILEAHMADEKFSVEELGGEMGMSRSHLHRKLKALIGQGPNQFIRSFRLNRAHDLLKVNAATTAEIAYTVGFSSPSYFTKCFHEQFGYTPTEISNQ